MGFSVVVVSAIAQDSDETAERVRIAAANMEDAVVVDCQLPGKLRRAPQTRRHAHLSHAWPPDPDVRHRLPHPGWGIHAG
jgi:hypothetical protein